MDIFRQRSYLLAAVAVLVVVDAAILVMLFRPPGGGTPSPSRRGEVEQTRVVRLLREVLGFDRRQVDAYLQLRRSHQERMKLLRDRMDSLKKPMFDDVLHEHPSLSDSLLRRTLDTQVEIERQTFRYLTGVKEICTPRQREQLQGILQELLHGKPEGRR